MKTTTLREAVGWIPDGASLMIGGPTNEESMAARHAVQALREGVPAGSDSMPARCPAT